MSWTPTDEQAFVKKIAHVLAQGYGTSGNKKVLDIDERVARAVLVAVGPMIAAQALRDAAGDMDAEYEERTAKVGAYGQTKVRAALLTGAGYARKRADQIEKEAGR